MTVLLLANVGNHDVQLNPAGTALLPEDLRERRIPPRQLGEELLSDYDRYAPAIELPLIGACLHWLLEHEQVPADQLYIHLFASDQGDFTPERERSKDSLPFAEVIKKHLTRNWPHFPKRQVRIHSIPGNPADYRNMLDYFTGALPPIADRTAPDDVIYLEVTGGTPAMTSMLIIAGIDAFGRRVKTLYVERGAKWPYQMGIGQRLFSRRARAALLTHIKLYAYSTAQAILEEEADLITTDTERQKLIAALLRYADRRLAFDFERARDALHDATLYATGKALSQVRAWSRKMQEKTTAALLEELIHSTAIKYELGDYADFTQRLFRFQEATFRYLAEQMGMRYKGKDNKYIDQSWVNEVDGLRAFLCDYTALDEQRYTVDIDRPLNRISLGAIVDFFIANDPSWKPLHQTVHDLHSLSRVSQLRNKGLAGHGFQGIGREDLAEAFDDDPDEIAPLLKKIYGHIFGYAPGPSPYEGVNELLGSLLQDR